MTPYYEDETVTLHHGDCLDVLRSLPDNSVDSIVTDPPYGLEFMGREWDGADGFRRSLNAADTGRNNVFGRTSRTSPEYRALHTFQQWCEQWATECLRVLKPGGHLLSFGGSRTWHRLTCAVEDAGFEIRDSIAWLYGSGFPKSLDVSKAIDKAAGAEREVIGTRLGLPGVSASGANQGNGVSRALEGREDRPSPALDVTAPATDAAQQWQGWGTALKPAFEPIVVGRKPFPGTVAGNVQEHGTGALNVDACRTNNPGPHGTRGNRKFDGFSNEPGTVYGTFQRGSKSPENPAGRWPTNVVLDDTQATELDTQTEGTRAAKGSKGSTRGGASGSVYGGGAGYGRKTTGQALTGYDDEGGASRFFPTFRYEAKAPTSERPRDGEIAHPTVKPLDLMRWLVRLVTPPGGTVLEPFAGSGTTAEACVIEGFQCIAVEREADYLPLIVARLSKPIQAALDFGEETAS